MTGDGSCENEYRSALLTSIVVTAEIPWGFPGQIDELGTPYSDGLGKDTYLQARPQTE